MTVDVDYYSMLGIDRDAGHEAIEAAVRKAMREWRKRTEAADLGVRQEAELKVKQIEEGRRTLLDPTQRAAYDRDLAGGVKEAVAPATQGGAAGGSWLDQAEGFLAIGDYHSAAYAAREATHVEEPNAKTWWIRSRANAGLGLWQDALYEARQSTAMDDNSAEYHFHLGSIHEHMNAFDDAITEYRRAGTCDPSNPMYELAVGGVYASNGLPDKALPIVEAVYNKHPDDANANYYLGSVLIQLAEEVPETKDSSGYIVTSEKEISEMRRLVGRAKGLKIVDIETRQAADHITTYLDDMERMVFRPPWSLILSGAAVGSEMGVWAAVVGGTCTIGIFLLPVILLLSGLGQLSSNFGSGILLTMIGGGLCWLWWKLMYVPKWKHAKRDL